jgi:very-short-patch-repair endonuclease
VAHDDSLDALAATQHGVVTRQQLFDLGLPRHAIDDRLGTGRLRRVHAGVYLVRGHALSWPAPLVAACLAAGPQAVASHRAAAFLHGLEGTRPLVELTVPLGRGPELAGVVVHRSRRLSRVDVGTVDGIPCTRPWRTIVDLAAVADGEIVECALDDGLRRRLFTCTYLRARLDGLGHRGRSGIGHLERLLAERTEGLVRNESHFERKLLSVLREAALPAPIPQYEVLLPTGRQVRIDFAYPALRIGLEADSYRHHSSKLDWARDHTRFRWLTALGWLLIPVTWDDLADPTVLIEQLRVASRSRAG